MPRAKGGSIPSPQVAIHPNHGGPISTLNENDVLSGRGGRINNHPGNITFRIVVENYKREYLDPRTRKLEKAHVAARLVAQIRSTNPPGRFLREDPENPGKYVEIGDRKAWKKAGQALREDAPDVRKEIDEDLEMVEEQQAKEKTNQIKDQSNYTPQHQPSYQQHQQPVYQQQQQQHHPGVPPGIPPSVSYSPTAAQPMPLAPISGGGSRPDPPEAPGVTGYRQPPLRYVASGRGGAGRGPGGGQNYPMGRGRGPPPPHHSQQPPQPQQYPPQQGYHPNYYGPPPYAPQHGQPQFHQPPHQYQQQPSYPHHPQYPPQQHGHHPNQQQHNGYNNGTQPPHPQFTAPQDKQGRKKTTSPIFAGPVQAVATGVHHTMDAVTGLANKFIHKRPSLNEKIDSVSRQGGSFPYAKSIASEFTMSDISGFGDSIRTNSAMLQSFQQQEQHPQQPIEVVNKKTQQQQGGAQKDSSTSKSSGGSRKSRDSFTISDLMSSEQSLNISFGHSGRTRSFPDLMLSTGDLLPPMEGDDSDVDILDNLDGKSKVENQRTSSGRMLRTPFHRTSSSESSNHSMTSLTLKGFHPVRSRINTATSGINDAMSIMSLDSRKSNKSEAEGSWLDNFRSMQSINSDMNPWESGGGGLNHSLKSQVMGDEGSVRSFLSDVSNDLNALDLAEPLLPPIMTDTGLNDSLAEFIMSRPDP